jgi:hypothetical protein
MWPPNADGFESFGGHSILKEMVHGPRKVVGGEFVYQILARLIMYKTNQSFYRSYSGFRPVTSNVQRELERTDFTHK